MGREFENFLKYASLCRHLADVIVDWEKVIKPHNVCPLDIALLTVWSYFTGALLFKMVFFYIKNGMKGKYAMIAAHI